jgi:hypothetical protein
MTLDLTKALRQAGQAQRGSQSDMGNLLRDLSTEVAELTDAEQTFIDDITATAAEINAVADVSGRLVTVAAPGALSAATHGDRVVLFTDADGALTLPNATGSGVRFKVVMGIAATSMTITVTDNTDEEFAGGVVGVDDDSDAAYAWKAEDDDDTITLNGAATGGKIHDWFEFTDIETGIWLVSGFITQSGGSEATPFSADITS